MTGQVLKVPTCQPSGKGRRGLIIRQPDLVPIHHQLMSTRPDSVPCQPHGIRSIGIDRQRRMNVRAAHPLRIPTATTTPGQRIQCQVPMRLDSPKVGAELFTASNAQVRLRNGWPPLALLGMHTAIGRIVSIGHQATPATTTKFSTAFRHYRPPLQTSVLTGFPFTGSATSSLSRFLTLITGLGTSAPKSTTSTYPTRPVPTRPGISRSASLLYFDRSVIRF